MAELCDALSREVASREAAVEAAEDVLALAERQHEQNELAELLNEPTNLLAVPLEVLRERPEEARKD